MPPEGLAIPGHGVYACLADGVPAAVNIGVRPTFGTGRAELIEAHLIDFEGDLYGHELRLRFLERLRGERRFDSAAALIDKMHDGRREDQGRSARLLPFAPPDDPDK